MHGSDSNVNKFVDCSIEERYYVRIDILEAYPDFDPPEKVWDISYDDDLNDFAHVYGTPASLPYLEFWCETKELAVKYTRIIQNIFESEIE